MTTIRKDPDRLYGLLPALYRIADAERGGELRALLALVTEQADALHTDTQQLWDDFFIETCQRWVIPYLGALVGNDLLHDLDLSTAARTAESLFKDDFAGPDFKPPGAIRTRADVAKTIYYRRRKGTSPMLEELARDVTGWGAHVVELFTLLDWNQHLEHLRLDCHGCPDLRRVDAGDRVGGPWDTATHTVDVRRINERDGWYNIPNIGFFLWRLGAYRLTKITPRAIGGTTWRLTFSPLGQDIPLFAAGRREAAETRLATEPDIEAPIRAAAFHEDLARVSPAIPSAFYGDPATTEASLVVFVDGLPVPASEVRCMNLAGWTLSTQPTGITIGIDVTRGRLVVPTGRAGQRITVSYFYGFSAPMGGGEYDRTKWMVPTPSPTLVSGGGAALNTAIAGRTGSRPIIQLEDDATYDLTSTITLAADESLTIQAKNGARPHLRLGGGALAILTSGQGASLTLSGLLIEGGLQIRGDLDRLRLLHTTLVPGRSVLQETPLAPPPPRGPSLVVAPGPTASPRNTRLEVQIAFSIVGALRIPSHITKLWLLDSIVVGIGRNGGPFGAAVSGASNTSGPPAHIERSTLFGASRFLKLELASESIFTRRVLVEQRQQGCVRFSYVPRGSATPQQYRCQPALETALAAEKEKTEAAKTGTPLPAGWEAALAARIARWLVPTFEADRYGRPELAQLRRSCPVQIRTGAEDGSEMGAFCTLKQPQRESNLRLRLDEYLPIGLEAGLIHVT